MKKLIITVGNMGSGKSTFLKNNGYSEYTIAKDEIRIMFGGLNLENTGSLKINNERNFSKKINKFFYELLKDRMENGVTTFVDACYLIQDPVKKYIDLANKYGYEIAAINFTDIDNETAMRQNQKREPFRIVPEEVFFDDEFKKRTLDFLNHHKIEILPRKKEEIDNFLNKDIFYDFSKYKKIYHIGDIQGCSDALQELIKNIGIHEENLYIFSGDILDRGIQNDKALILMNNILKNDNTILIEGNHDTYMRQHINNLPIISDEFLNSSLPQIQSKVINYRKIMKKIMNKSKDVVIYKYNEKYVMVCHGGLSVIPLEPWKISSKQYIKGSGYYQDQIDQIFSETIKNKNHYQIHGHRNIKDIEINTYPNSFNLETKVEFGGYLSCVELSSEGFNFIKVKNNVFNRDLVARTEASFKK